MVKDAGTTIEYVYIEMVLNKEHKYEVISGMFQGIKVRDGSTFILVHGKKDVTNIINLRYYNIMTIEILHKDHKDMTYLTMKDDDQKAALVMLSSVYKKLLEDNLGQEREGDLINVSRYTNIPEDRGGNTVTKQYSQQDKTTHIQYNGVGDFANRTRNNTSTYNSTKKKEIVPTVFNRTTGSKKPSKASLELMREKIDLINDGNFECVLPKLIGATEEDDDDTTNMYNQENLHWA